VTNWPRARRPSSPIAVQVQDVNFDRAAELARRLLARMQRISGVADAHSAQVLSYPAPQVDVDRPREALAHEVAQGPAVRIVTIAQGAQERLITLLGDTRPIRWRRCTARGAAMSVRSRWIVGSGSRPARSWRRLDRWKLIGSTTTLV
jgi:hypothetical protein